MRAWLLAADVAARRWDTHFENTKLSIPSDVVAQKGNSRSTKARTLDGSHEDTTTLIVLTHILVLTIELDFVLIGKHQHIITTNTKRCDLFDFWERGGLRTCVRREKESTCCHGLWLWPSTQSSSRLPSFIFASTPVISQQSHPKPAVPEYSRAFFLSSSPPRVFHRRKRQTFASRSRLCGGHRRREHRASRHGRKGCRFRGSWSPWNPSDRISGTRCW